MESSLGLILFNPFFIQSRLISINSRHEKKLFNLGRQNVSVNDSLVVIKQITHNFSDALYKVTVELALCYGLD